MSAGITAPGDTEGLPPAQEAPQQTAMSAVAGAQAPVITVVRGRPGPAELAAVVAVLLAAGTAAAAAVPAAPPRFSAWMERSRSPHGLPRPGPQAWRASGLPR